MSRKWLSALAAVGVLACGGAPAHAQQFSADLSIVPRDGAAAVPAARLYVSGNKVRLEAAEFADGFFLIDGAVPSATFVRPAARIFMDARQSSRLTQWFVPVDPANPCPQWKAMAKLAESADHGEWRCERVGEEKIDGQATVGYRVIASSGPEFSGWIDAFRKFPLRIRTGDGAVITACNVRDEPLSARLFEIEAGFRKFDPEALIERIKQSDVWVAGEQDLNFSRH